MTLLELENHNDIEELKIPSGVHAIEGNRLAYLVSQLPEYSIVVEIGACRGRSTAYIASAIRECKKKAIFFSVDVWELGASIGTPRKHYTDQPFQQYKMNLKSLGVFEYVTPLQSTSKDAAYEFSRADKRIDLLFIDGDHRYEGVKDDYLKWSYFLKSGGVIAFHDYKTAHEGVTQAVDEFITADRWEDLLLIDTLFTAKRKA